MVSLNAPTWQKLWQQQTVDFEVYTMSEDKARNVKGDLKTFKGIRLFRKGDFIWEENHC